MFEKYAVQVGGTYSTNQKGAMTLPELETSHLGDDHQLTSGVQHSQHSSVSQGRDRLRAGDWNGHFRQTEGNVQDSKNGYAQPPEPYLPFLKLPNTPLSCQTRRDVFPCCPPIWHMPEPGPNISLLLKY